MRVLVLDPLAEEGMDYLRRHAQAEAKYALSPEELVEAIPGYHALIVRSRTEVTAQVIQAGKDLVVIGRAGVGVDNIDLEAATRRGIVVVNAPASSTIAAAEHTIGLMLALARSIPQAHISLREGRWERQSFLGVELKGKTLGIVGLGRIGGEVARRAKGFQMQVIACDPFIPESRAQELGVEMVSLEELLRRADFISLHVPLTPSTQGMIGQRELSLLQPSARLINTARGEVVDEKALLSALNEGWLAGAALDVFTTEPPLGSPLLTHEKVIITPHLGASTAEAQSSVSLDIAREVVAVLEGRPALHAVNAPLVTAEDMARLRPYMGLAEAVGRLLAQTMEGQLERLWIAYRGEIAELNTRPLRAALLKGLLGYISEEYINLVNADLIARSRGLRVVEEHTTNLSHYANLISSEAETSQGGYSVAGTVMREEVHIVRIDDYWLDFVPSGYLLLAENIADRPGLLGRVGTILGDAQVNISFMQAGKGGEGGKALMVLGVDEPVPEKLRQQILGIPSFSRVKLVRCEKESI